jgi:hypothetical protein
MPIHRPDRKPYGCPGATAANNRGVNALCCLIPAVGAIAALIDEPAEVLGYVADLQDGVVDLPGTKSFIEGINGLMDQGAKFLKSIGG